MCQVIINCTRQVKIIIVRINILAKIYIQIDLHLNASAYSKHKTESTVKRRRKKDKRRTESDLDKEGGRVKGSNIGRRAGDHHQVKSSRNAPANNLKFKLRAGLQI